MQGDKRIADGPHVELRASIREYCRRMECASSLLDDARRTSALQLGEWIRKELEENGRADIIVICTGNSRRSMLGSIMGNIAADYYDISGIEFFSGGTSPSAFNSRTITALRSIGLQIDAFSATDSENPEYAVNSGSRTGSEFSKRFDNPVNPRDSFAALLVCDDAAESCPTVPGAAIRIPCPFRDPKAADDTPLEFESYERSRDEIAAFMLTALGHVRCG